MKRSNSWTRRQAGLAAALLGMVFMIAPGKAQDPEGDAILARFDVMVQYNLDNPHVLESSVIDAEMGKLGGKPVGERIAHWADFFYRDGRSKYLFGLDPGGYVKEGRLCNDFQTDCVLFLCRTTELGRSSTAKEAVQFAFGTRFYGASVEGAILPDGKVRYEDDAHLDYSEDILRTGIWGNDVSSEIGPCVPDPGNANFEADTLRFIPKFKVDESKIQAGDLVYFILDEENEKGAEERAKGVLIAHLGILTRGGDDVYLIHAAAKPLSGVYEGGKVEKVLLNTYLERIEHFKGIVVTRIEEF